MYLKGLWLQYALSLHKKPKKKLIIKKSLWPKSKKSNNWSGENAILLQHNPDYTAGCKSLCLALPWEMNVFRFHFTFLLFRFFFFISMFMFIFYPGPLVLWLIILLAPQLTIFVSFIDIKLLMLRNYVIIYMTPLFSWQAVDLRIKIMYFSCNVLI